MWTDFCCWEEASDLDYWLLSTASLTGETRSELSLREKPLQKRRLFIRGHDDEKRIRFFKDEIAEESVYFKTKEAGHDSNVG